VRQQSRNKPHIRLRGDNVVVQTLVEGTYRDWMMVQNVKPERRLGRAAYLCRLWHERYAPVR
jgi:hypothetical protein